MQAFSKRFEITPLTRILDVGGGWFNWTLIPEKPSLTFINIITPKESKVTNAWIIADGCHQPFEQNAFDIVYSNSVIEHLGNRENQRLFAAECMRVGIQYYVQTPNKRFIVEPHLITPFIHWFPRHIQKRMLRNFTVWGLIARPTQQRCEEFLDEVRLLDKNEMQHLFPHAEIWHERLLGWTKSLIAVERRGS
jgi:predicted SAM-dependent methyltransferase